ncbi:MAG TPA: helix-turn-helix transcriptional regulator [Balneolales bacterium]|nr:helix-turn-helix transcriptional regulator [Balneolales bacterium]
MTTKEIKSSFDQFFDSFSEEELFEQRAHLLAFKFLSEIEKAMEEEGVNRKELAQRIGTSASYITQLFRGDRLLNFNTLAKIEKVLDLDFEIKDKANRELSKNEIPNPFDKKIDPQVGFWAFHAHPDYSVPYEPIQEEDEYSNPNLAAA